MNRVSDANDAVWALVQATFANADILGRNPTGTAAPKPKTPGQTPLYVDMTDDKSPEVIRVLNGPLYDLKLSPKVTIVLLAKEEDRRPAAWAALEQMKAALAADRTLGGVVEYARVEAAEEADADRLEWMAGGLRVPICLLFNAPTEAG